MASSMLNEMMTNSMLRMLAAEYKAAPSLTLTSADKQELRVFILRQYREILDAGIHVVLCDADPYKDHDEMFWDVVNNQTLKVYTGGTPSPVLGHNLNVMFRAVHDFHHVKCGGDFTLKGEIKAFCHIASLLENVTLRKMMFSEIVLQAATAIKTGAFPEQRIVDSELIHEFA
jgi:hypothetical protein